MPKSKSVVQSVLFDIKKFNSRSARKWLREHDYPTIKRVDKTKSLLRYRLKEPSLFKKFRIKNLGKGIKVVLGFK